MWRKVYDKGSAEDGMTHVLTHRQYYMASNDILKFRMKQQWLNNGEITDYHYEAIELHEKRDILTKMKIRNICDPSLNLFEFIFFCQNEKPK